MAGPFKMKGSPMQRNFGIGSPLHENEKKTKTKVVKGPTIFGNTMSDIKSKLKKAGKYLINNPTMFHVAYDSAREAARRTNN